MKNWPQLLICVLVAVGGVFVAPAGTGAETATLKLKRLEPLDGATTSRTRRDRAYRAASPQRFFIQVGFKRRGSPADAFAKIVKKQPDKYRSEHPFRGVATLGSHKYAFALDLMDGGSTKRDLLYFDLNRNGDLTDDKPIRGPARKKAGAAEKSVARDPKKNYVSHHTFPRVNLKIDIVGTEVDYAFFLSARVNVRGKLRYGYVSLQSAVYREGKIKLGGKTTPIVLLDFNSNGRFDDVLGVRKLGRASTGRVYLSYGDLLLVDRDQGGGNVVAAKHFAAKLIDINGRYYDLEVSPVGDKLTLTPSSAPLGHVATTAEGLEAMLYGDKGIVKISGGKSEPIAVPEGTWKLLSYTISRTEREKPVKKARSTAELLIEALKAAAKSPQTARVSAGGTNDCKTIEVREGQTVVLPFGPPYKPIVKGPATIQAGKTVRLGLSVVGAGDETCNSMMVGRKRPAKPEFTINTPDGKEVATGNFEYG